MITAAQFKNNQHRQRKAEELEKKIDNAINAAAAFGDLVVTIGTGGYPQDVVEQVARDYRRVGWRAEHVIDPRDGDFLKLEAV